MTCRKDIKAFYMRVNDDGKTRDGGAAIVPVAAPRRSSCSAFSSPVGLQLDRHKLGVACSGDGIKEAILPLADRVDVVQRLPR